MKDAWLSFTAGTIHLLISLYYFFSAIRIRSFFERYNLEKPLPNPILNNWPAILFLLFAIANFYFGNFRRKKAKRDEVIKYSSIISILLMISPFVVMYIIGLYSSMNVLKLLKETGIY